MSGSASTGVRLKNIKEIMVEKGVLPNDVIRATGISGNKFKDITGDGERKGKRIPQEYVILPMARKIANTLDVTLEELAGVNMDTGEGNPRIGPYVRWYDPRVFEAWDITFLSRQTGIRRETLSRMEKNQTKFCEGMGMLLSEAMGDEFHNLLYYDTHVPAGPLVKGNLSRELPSRGIHEPQLATTSTVDDLVEEGTEGEIEKKLSEINQNIQSLNGNVNALFEILSNDYVPEREEFEAGEAIQEEVVPQKGFWNWWNRR